MVYDFQGSLIPIWNRNQQIIDYTIVDDEIYTKVKDYRFHKNDGYAYNRTIGRLQRYVMDCKYGDGNIVDHIYHDRMNNVKDYLRKVSPYQNSLNQRKKDGTTSKYYGVSFSKCTEKWTVVYQSKYYGCYGKEYYAAQVYNMIAKHFDKDDPRLNAVENIEFIEDIVYQKEKIKYISQTKTNKYKLTIKKIKYYKLFDNIEDAINERDTLLAQNKNLAEQNIVFDEEDIPIIQIKQKGQTLTFQVSIEDYHFLKSKSLDVKHGYLYFKQEGKNIAVNRYIMYQIEKEPFENAVADHIDNNVNNYQRSNFRWASRSENVHNRKKQNNKLIGVSKYKNGYDSCICKNGINYKLGSYETPYLASMARDLKAIELYGNCAQLNNVDFTNYQLKNERLHYKNKLCMNLKQQSGEKYFGVTKSERETTFQAQYIIAGQTHIIGRFDTACWAAIAREIALLRLQDQKPRNLKLNGLDTTNYSLIDNNLYYKGNICKESPKDDNFVGVTYKDNKFRSRYMKDRQEYYVGAYDTALEAAIARELLIKSFSSNRIKLNNIDTSNYRLDQNKKLIKIIN